MHTRIHPSSYLCYSRICSPPFQCSHPRSITHGATISAPHMVSPMINLSLWFLMNRLSSMHMQLNIYSLIFVQEPKFSMSVVGQGILLRFCIISSVLEVKSLASIT